MAVKKRGLGRGLDALLGSSTARPVPDAAGEPADAGLHSIALDLIQPGKYQPRKDMDPSSLEELAQSIKVQGIMQPIVLRTVAAGKYEIIAGERRWRAARLAGLDRIDAIVREVPDEAAIAMALIENIQREDLNPVEEAVALHRLQQEYELTQQEVADAVGKSRATVANLLRLLALPEEVKTLVAHGDIEMGHARAILGLPAEQQAEAARHVAAEGMTVRQTEAHVRAVQQPKSEPQVKPEDPDIRRLEQKLAERLGAMVRIRHGAKGKGQLVIQYASLDELQSVLARMH
ncbi:ParB/RepB/Spo0J family partition protein [Thiopseudomonas denitrificans]|uniref:Probable chromosome-partitioning protein ParB n=1 Tax=Thiopseudomonas denitrificans TaxID=1501432 RepID=A0A4R6TVA0_9GAMM|nr:ParB/RepB/Spo0J family partition protein [Thiopseudomonas denitrificans]TDQ37341.1 chromosome segregation DNA-binding protein [Thiopseudomonas denitrificans]